MSDINPSNAPDRSSLPEPETSLPVAPPGDRPTTRSAVYDSFTDRDVNTQAPLRRRNNPLRQYTLSVLIPVYNEVATLLELLDRVRDVEINKEVILVDDGSTDGTRDLLAQQVEGKFSDVKVFYHAANQGKGAAIRTAIAQATGDYCIVQDADLEYDPREYYTLLEPLLDGRADVVYGSRFLGGGAHRVHFFWHRLGNGLLTLLSNMLTNLNLTDMEVCYKVFKRELLQSLNLRCNKFDFEPEVTAKVAKKRCRIYEVPISYSGRDYEEGKKIGWRDGVQAIWTILKYRYVD